MGYFELAGTHSFRGLRVGPDKRNVGPLLPPSVLGLCH